MNEDKLSEWIERWLEDEEAQESVEQDRENGQEIRNMLTTRAPEELSEEDVVQILSLTRAMGSSTNARGRLNEHSLEVLQQRFGQLTDLASGDPSADAIEETWQRSAVGKSLATEVLQAVSPDRFWHIQKPVKEMLQQLVPASDMPRLHETGYDATLYEGVGRALDRVVEALEDAGIADADYLTATRLLMWAANNAPGSSNGSIGVESMKLHLAAKGFNFTDWQIATFFTALQTKGFVILSGISGTGKTKLAQHFAKMLPEPVVGLVWPEDMLSLTVKPYMLKYSKFIFPKRTRQFMDFPGPGEKIEVDVRFPSGGQTCLLNHRSYENTDYIELLLRGDAGEWFRSALDEDERFGVEPEHDETESLVGLRLLKEHEVAQQSTEKSDNYLFVPVRPDWRDSKSLLGYFNPLTEEYRWPDFLRFVIRARDNYESNDEDTVAWFVILDEMNLARVEYYFADLLSVLESGRDEDGMTVEPLRPEYPEDATGELPPNEVHLPPNLYVIGTVNVDETTHAFSPKVLDRAFSIRMTEVDFEDYPKSVISDVATISEAEEQLMLDTFSRNGLFAVIDKSAIAEFVDAYPKVRSRLHNLNEQLKEYDLHFAYRVFDEIVAFLDAAEETGMYEDLRGLDGALDAAVLMKVLPKFHGSRGKLEAPLQAIFAWCCNPDNPQASVVKENLRDLGEDRDVRETLEPETTVYPRTAIRVAQMLRDLYTEGFTAFS